VHEAYHAYEYAVKKNGERWMFSPLGSGRWYTHGSPKPGVSFVSLYGALKQNEDAAELARAFVLYPRWLEGVRSQISDSDVAVFEQHVFRPLAEQKSLLPKSPQIVMPRIPIVAAVVAVSASLAFIPQWGWLGTVSVLFAGILYLHRQRNQRSLLDAPVVTDASEHDHAIRYFRDRLTMRRSVWPLWVWTAINAAQAAHLSLPYALVVWVTGLALYWIVSGIEAPALENSLPEMRREARAIVNFLLVVLAYVTFWTSGMQNPPREKPEQPRSGFDIVMNALTSIFTGAVSGPGSERIYMPVFSVRGQSSVPDANDSAK